MEEVLRSRVDHDHRVEHDDSSDAARAAVAQRRHLGEDDVEGGPFVDKYRIDEIGRRTCVADGHHVVARSQVGCRKRSALGVDDAGPLNGAAASRLPVHFIRRRAAGNGYRKFAVRKSGAGNRRSRDGHVEQVISRANFTVIDDHIGQPVRCDHLDHERVVGDIYRAALAEVADDVEAKGEKYRSVGQVAACGVEIVPGEQHLTGKGVEVADPQTSQVAVEVLDARQVDDCWIIYDGELGTQNAIEILYRDIHTNILSGQARFRTHIEDHSLANLYVHLSRSAAALAVFYRDLIYPGKRRNEGDLIAMGSRSARHYPFHGGIGNE